MSLRPVHPRRASLCRGFWPLVGMESAAATVRSGDWVNGAEGRGRGEGTARSGRSPGAEGIQVITLSSVLVNIKRLLEQTISWHFAGYVPGREGR